MIVLAILAGAAYGLGELPPLAVLRLKWGLQALYARLAR